MSLREQLDQIRSQYGKLTPAAVVNEARDPDHPLHTRFEWDDAVAGDKYRLSQARQLIAVVKVQLPATKDHDPVNLRAYHSVPSDDGDGKEYVPSEEVAVDPVLRAMVLRAMEREFKQLQLQYGHMSEFFDLLTVALEAA